MSGKSAHFRNSIRQYAMARGDVAGYALAGAQFSLYFDEYGYVAVIFAHFSSGARKIVWRRNSIWDRFHVCDYEYVADLLRKYYHKRRHIPMEILTQIDETGSGQIDQIAAGPLFTGKQDDTSN